MKFIATRAPTFIGYIISVLDSVRGVTHVEISKQSDLNLILFLFYVFNQIKVEWWNWLLQKDGKPFSTSLTMADRELVVPQSSEIDNQIRKLESAMVKIELQKDV